MTTTPKPNQANDSDAAMQASDFVAADGDLAKLKHLRVSFAANVAHVELNRPDKRNALSDDMVREIQWCFSNMPESVRAIILTGQGKHFCAGLDLSSLAEHGPAGGMRHSQMWHAAFRQISFGPAPVIAVLHGAVIGGGLELASNAHIRIAEDDAFFRLPEGQHGLFLGGGGSVRITRLIGAARVTDMMLTGRKYGADDGERIGLASYRVGQGDGFAHALSLAKNIASNAVLSNYAIMHALPRIAEQSPEEGLFTESLIAAIAQSDDSAKTRMKNFVDGRRGPSDKSA